MRHRAARLAREPARPRGARREARALAGDALDGALEEAERPAGELLAIVLASPS